MDFLNPLIMIVGLGSAAFIAAVVVYGVVIACSSAWGKFGHRDHGHHGHHAH